jgi:uroporphyrinogen decarboxylase
MNAQQRVSAVLNGKETDRRAFAMTLSLYGARLTKTDAVDYFSDPKLYAAGQRAVVDLCGPDILFGPFAFALEAEAFGAIVERFHDAPPVVRKPAFRSARHTEGIRMPSPADHPRLRFLIDSVRELVQDQAGERPVAAPIIAPTDLPNLLVGMDAWLELLLFEPEPARFWSRVALDHFLALAHAYAEAGAAFLVMPIMMISPSFVDQALADRVLKPLLKEAFERTPIPVVFHHGGNRLTPNLNIYKDLPNLAGFALDEKDSFKEARDILGPAPVLLGNLSGPHVSRRSPADMEARIRALLADRNMDRRYIFAGSGADIPYDTDPGILASIRSILEEPLLAGC